MTKKNGTRYVRIVLATKQLRMESKAVATDTSAASASNLFPFTTAMIRPTSGLSTSMA
jgi:hypothetical protein